MKYGESSFDLYYLITTIVAGIWMLRHQKNRGQKWMGIATLILGCGDAFHLVPRVLNYFVQGNFTAALGIGKLVTSITMTVFYVLMVLIWSDVLKKPISSNLKNITLGLCALRIVLCLFPQNGWLKNDSNMLWGILRNIPFVLLGILVIFLYYQERKNLKGLERMWLWMCLSFAFYIPVAVFAELLPILGMLMLPKTICYMAMVYAFYKIIKRAQ